MTIVARVKAAATALFRPVGTLSAVGTGRGWHPLFSDWHRNFQTDELDIKHDSVLAFSTVYACITLIASDIGKLCLRLMQPGQGGVWVEGQSPAFSPVLRKPNHFQTRQQFIETWIVSKLTRGNAYILKERDGRGVVVRMYVLDPTRVQPLVAPNGDVFYQLQSDDLSRLPTDYPAVPASEIIHDRMECLFHPLIGVSPIFASGLAATQGLKIQKNSAKFFQNMSRPSGVLVAPEQISDETAKRLKEHWEANYGGDKMGGVAVLGDGLKYEAMTITPVDAQMAEQLKLSGEQVCSTFHVPPYMVGVGAMPSFDNVQALNQQYYSQCLQKLIESVEALLDDGLSLDPAAYRTEFDLDDLLRMDGKTLAEVEGIKVQRGISAPDEARRKFNLPPVSGGSSPYLQQQNFSLEALAKRDAQADPFRTARPADTKPDAQSDPQAEELAKLATYRVIASARKALHVGP